MTDARDRIATLEIEQVRVVERIDANVAHAFFWYSLDWAMASMFQLSSQRRIRCDREASTFDARDREICHDVGVKPKTDAGAKQVDGYLARLDPEHRETLDVVRERLRAILPHATECLKYGMPSFVLDGKGIAAYAGFKAHCSYFPFSSAVLGAAGRAVAAYPVSKGGLRFLVGKPLSVALLRRLVKLRLAEITDAAKTARRRST